MRLTILIPGTQGDVRPFVALGARLQAGGHAVRLCTTADFTGLVEGSRLDFSPLSGDLRAIAAENQAAFEGGRNPVSMMRTAQRITRALVAPWVEEGAAACGDADLIMAGGSAVLLGAALAEALGKPFVQAYLHPHILFGDLPSAFLPVPSRPLPAFANRVTNWLLECLSWQALRPAVNDVIRGKLGLPPYPWYGPLHLLKGGRWPILYGFSEHVVPRPARLPRYASITGYWFLDGPGDWQPPSELAAFLEDGPKPVYIGFGSMYERDAQALTDRVVRAVRLSGCRAVLATGWGGLASRPEVPADRILIIDGAPHDWLFPRVAAAIHHGGAGTTAAAIRAGIPSIAVPFFGDQFFWAWRLEQLGVAPPTLRRKVMTPQDLAGAIALAGGAAMQARARALGQRVKAEQGLAAAVDAVSAWGLLSPA
jgi:UDP:flavonoid glycosyltransferase YjiC (YdhE family)